MPNHAYFLIPGMFAFFFLHGTCWSSRIKDEKVEKLFIKAFKDIHNDMKMSSHEKYETLVFILRSVYFLERKRELDVIKQESAKKIRDRLKLKNEIEKLTKSSFIFDFMPSRF